MQRHLLPASDGRRKGDVIAGERRVVKGFDHRSGVPKPIDVKTVKIQRVLGDLLRGAKEKRVVDVERLANKGNETGESQQNQPGFRPDSSWGIFCSQVYGESFFRVCRAFKCIISQNGAKIGPPREKYRLLTQ